jgi:hypothetical protein
MRTHAWTTTRRDTEAWSAILDSLISSTDVESCRPITQASSLRLPRGFHGHCRATSLTSLWGPMRGICGDLSLATASWSQTTQAQSLLGLGSEHDGISPWIGKIFRGFTSRVYKDATFITSLLPPVCLAYLAQPWSSQHHS